MKKQIATIVMSTLLLSGCASWCEEPCQPTSYTAISASELFAFDSAKLSSEDIAELNPVIERLKAEPSERVEINGYASSEGPADYNLRLSERRAQSVASYLESKGICPTRITTKGYGEENPVASNETAAGRAQNRRAELITYK